MILGVAIANITRNLDILSKKDGQSVSSHSKLKEEGLTCLKALVEEAPASEYLIFLDAEDHAILLAYTLNVLCQISKNDKSKSIRTQSLEVMLSLMNRLEIIHETNRSSRKCSIQPVVSALPGVSSTLFRLIMSDTKLPRSLLIIAIRNLSKLICMTFISCQHKPHQENPSEEEANKLKDICDNLAIRLNFLIDYATSNASELPAEMQYEVLDLCHSIMRKCNCELLIRATESIVKYLAFVSADGQSSKTKETQLKIMLMTDCMKDKVQNSDDGSQKLDSVIISGIFKVLDNLETHAFSVLIKDRQSELAILLGFLRLLPDESLTLFLELEDRRNQLINMLIRLSEFSTNQPFLLLTESKVMGDAIEISNSKIYSVEKRFTYLTSDEIQLVSEICHIIGSSTEWPSLNDIITNDLRRFSDSSNLYITNLILKGCLVRKNLNSNSVARFTAHMLRYYIDSTEEEYVRVNGTIDQGSPKNTLAIVIAIETIATTVDMHLKFVISKAKRVILLKDLLCPLLKWASSSSRAVSEAALSDLTQISQLYEYDSVKSLIEANIDYIVDGVMHMLENFSHNCDVTNVLAVTFKLSSKSSFYYFKDVFERIFRVLAIYQNTEKAQSILLLFYRTLGTLIGWSEAISGVKPRSPLENEATLKSVIHDLAIDRRIEYLAKKRYEFLKQAEIVHEEKAEDESKIIEDAIKSGKMPDFTGEKEASESENKEPDEKKERPNEIVLTEKILDHCASMISSDYPETKILALKTAALGFEILRSDEDTLLPLVHKLWKPLANRLVGDYGQNLEVSLCAFECLISMAENARDFIKSRTLDSIIPRICVFLESQARESLGKMDYGPYAMTVAYKCQLKILTHLGSLAYHIELAYSNLWRVVRTTLLYLNTSQMKSLREAAQISLHYMMALDADCVWYYSKQSNFLHDLPFQLVYEQFC